MAVGAESKWAIRIMVSVLVLSLLMVTAGLFFMNIQGAWIASGGNLPYTVVIGGVELLAAVSLTLAVRRRGLQRGVGIVIFAASVWICIENGKFSIHEHFADKFPDRPDVLEAKADALDAQADLIRQDPAAAQTGLQMRLDRKIADKVKAEAEVALMTDKTRTREAQEHLQALGLYEGRIDGIKDKLTEDATRKRGAELNRQIQQLTGEISELDVLVQSSSSEGGILGLKMEAIALRGQADTAREGTTWMNRLLLGTELARSFGFWAYFTSAMAAALVLEGASMPARQPFRLPQIRLAFWRKDEEPHTNAAEAGTGNDVDNATESSDLPKLTSAQINGHLGGSATQHGREAAKKTRILIGPTLTVDGGPPVPENAKVTKVRVMVGDDGKINSIQEEPA